MTTQSLHEESQSANKDDGLHAPMLGKTSPMLSYFCVYNPSLGPTEENTKDQILYYTAKRVVPADVKMKQVGLAQALVKFTSAFSPSKPTQNVHTQKNRMIFLQPEPGFWMYMCVELGILRRQIRDAKGKEKLVTEYLDTQLSDRALESVLKIGYEQFKLLHGTFSYILYQDDEDISGLPSRQRTRSLMHCIEEFFSEWIWKWDFDRLDTMVFSAVFNGVPVQPILRTNYLKVHELDRALHERFNQSIDHVLVFDSDEGGLLYRSPSLNIRDVCALRKYVFKRIEKSIAREKEVKQRQADRELTDAKKDKISGLKFFTKSISQSHFLGFFTSSLSTKTTAPVTSAPVSAVGSQTSLPDLLDTAEAAPEIEADANPDTMDINPKNGKYLTGLVQSTSVDMNGDERTVTRIEMAQVYLSSRSALDTSPDKPHNSTYGHSKDDEDEILTEYYLVIYKHKANIVWSFLLPSFSQEAEDLLADQKFYSMLEKYMVEEQNLNGITEAIVSNVRSAQEKSNSLGKHYKCFYYDNATLNMKSTMVNQQGRIISKYQNDGKFVGGIPMTNDMLLQLLDLKEDFERLPRTTEIYTRSIANYWIAGHRLYNTVLTRDRKNEDIKDTKDKPANDTETSTEETDNVPKASETTSTSEASDQENSNDKKNGDNRGEDKGCSFEEHFSRSSIDSVRTKSIEDYTEIYLVAAKKDTSLADVEETLNRMTTSLVDAMHLE